MEDKEALLRVLINAAQDLDSAQNFIRRQHPTFELQSLKDVRALIAVMTK